MARKKSRVDVSRSGADGRRKSTVRSRNEIKREIREALKRAFPEDTVDVSDGYADNIHVLVVSRKFDAMEEQAKQDMLWGLIDKQIPPAESRLISLVLPLSPAEIK